MANGSSLLCVICCPLLRCCGFLGHCSCNGDFSCSRLPLCCCTLEAYQIRVIDRQPHVDVPQPTEDSMLRRSSARDSNDPDYEDVEHRFAQRDLWVSAVMSGTRTAFNDGQLDRACPSREQQLNENRPRQHDELVASASSSRASTQSLKPQPYSIPRPVLGGFSSENVSTERSGLLSMGAVAPTYYNAPDTYQSGGISLRSQKSHSRRNPRKASHDLLLNSSSSSDSYEIPAPSDPVTNL